MPAAPDGVDLLERSLGYTRTVLSRVRDADLDRPTPCEGWDLDTLLDHMDDALLAFVEAADGVVAPPVTTPASARAAACLDARHRVARLQATACALLGAWSATPARVVHLGPWLLPADQVAATAALEIAVHGWDVARTLEPDRPAPSLPPRLALALGPVAGRVVCPEDRGGRFGPALAVPSDADLGVRLLALLGRRGA